MIGKPRFKIGDRVEFDIEGKRYHGNIYIIDAYGTFEDESNVSYDIMVDNWDNNHNECLFKHVNENLIITHKDNKEEQKQIKIKYLIG